MEIRKSKPFFRALLTFERKYSILKSLEKEGKKKGQSKEIIESQRLITRTTSWKVSIDQLNGSYLLALIIRKILIVTLHCLLGKKGESSLERRFVFFFLSSTTTKKTFLADFFARLDFP